MNENNNPLLKLKSLGQSVWIDYIRRGMLESGEFARLIDRDGVSGVTSNPSIFYKAIAETHEYDAAIATAARRGRSAAEIYDELIIQDIQRAADLLRPIYDRSDGRDGYVSLEVSPHLARDTAGTIDEAQRLWDTTNRPNIFIKVPGTMEGLPAVQQLISEGININITLLFGLSRYFEVAQAYIEGLELLADREHSLERIASVASFFLSRIDTLVDPQLEKFMELGGKQGALAGKLRGQVAIASAKVAWQVCKEIFGGERFRSLSDLGGRPQRLLWASTSTKNKEYSDVKYVDSIVARGTINTMPAETVEAYRDHGKPAIRIEDGVSEAYWILERLDDLGIAMDSITQQLEEEGIERFVKDYDKLMEAIEQKRAVSLEERKAA